MPSSRPELDTLLRSLSHEGDDADPPTIDLPAVLSDPLLHGVIERALEPYARIFSERGLDHARRTLALIFTTDPTAVAALARLRGQSASGAVRTGRPAAAPADRRRKP
jgi:hypothetical protein